MTTTILTGRDLSVTIDGKAYDAQTKSAELTVELDRSEHELLSGRVRQVVDETGVLNVTMLADWGATESLCRALWNAAATDPNTPLAFTMEVNGETASGELLPVKPPISGSGKDATELTLAFPVEGVPALAAQGG